MNMYGQPRHACESLGSDALTQLISIGWVVVNTTQYVSGEMLPEGSTHHIEYLLRWGRSDEERTLKSMELTVKVRPEK